MFVLQPTMQGILHVWGTWHTCSLPYVCYTSSVLHCPDQAVCPSLCCRSPLKASCMTGVSAWSPPAVGASGTAPGPAPSLEMCWPDVSCSDSSFYGESGRSSCCLSKCQSACKEKKPCRTLSHACLALPIFAGRHFCSWPKLHSACNVHHLLSCFSPALHTLILQGGAGAPSQPPSAGGVAAELLPATARGKLGTAVQNLPATCCPGCTMLLCTKQKGKSARRPVSLTASHGTADVQWELSTAVPAGG